LNDKYCFILNYYLDRRDANKIKMNENDREENGIKEMNDREN